MAEKEKHFMNIQLFAEPANDGTDEIDDEDIDFDNLDEISEDNDEDLEIALDETEDDEGSDGEDIGAKDAGDGAENDNDDADSGGNKENDAIAKLEKERDEWKKKYARLESQSNDTLAKLGVKREGSTEEALEKAAAEAEGIPLAEYRKKRQEAADIEAAKQLVKQQKLEEMFASDLTELKKSFPELVDIKHITKINNFEVFGRLRDNGIPVKEAYLAANGDSVMAKQATAAKQKAASDSKKHIQSAISRKANVTTVTMPKSVLEEWRGMFPDKTDSEIAKLYKQTL